MASLYEDSRMLDACDEQSVDKWSEWLLRRRHGDDPKFKRRIIKNVNRVRDRVLSRAKLGNDKVLADIGTGTGLIAFEAIRRIGPTLKVNFVDISIPLLRRCKVTAIKRGVINQCEFFQCSADNLAKIADESVDVITTRSVLAYVANKAAALKEFYRVLKPGGRISLSEPIFQDFAFENIALRGIFESQSLNQADPSIGLLLRWRATQFPDTADEMAKNPLTNYSERDLFRSVTQAGFHNQQMQLHIQIDHGMTSSWDAFLASSPHPLAPTVESVLSSQFNCDERHLFERMLRPLIEQKKLTFVDRIAYVRATKPAECRFE